MKAQGMSDVSNTGKWLNGNSITPWLVQKGIYVIIAAAVFWLELHFVSKRDFDDNKAEQLKYEQTLNELLHSTDLHLKEFDDNHKHDAAVDVDHEARIRKLEEKR
jgi:hypothetical protein